MARREHSGSRFRARALALGVAGSLAAVSLGIVSGPASGTTATPDPSGLQLLSTVEAGHMTLANNGPNGAPFQTDTTIEPSIAVNPANPLEIVTGTQTGRDDAGGGIDNGFSTSHDGGKTWVSGALPDVTSATGNSLYPRASDAVVAWGPGETVYYSSLVFDPTGANLRSGVVNSTSHDGGLTWDNPTTVQTDLGGGLNDKNWTAVDLSKAPGHHYGRVYVVWDRVAGIYAKYSDDGGLTWNPPSPAIAPLVFQGQGIGSLPMIEPNGDLAIAFESGTMLPPLSTPGEDLGEAVTDMTQFAVAVAPMAGTLVSPAPLVFEPAVTVATYEGNAVRGQRAGSLLDAATDPKTGRIYVVWEDSRWRTDSNNDIAISHSDNEGLTWTAPARVNLGATADQVDHYDPSIDIGSDSSVRVMWRQRQETASADVSTYAPYVSTWIAQSKDGTTFLPALQVDRHENDVRFAAFSRDGAFQGDYDEVVTLGNVSYLVYCDSYPADGEAAPTTPGDTTVHHQRTIVSIVEPASVGAPAVAPPAPVVQSAPVTKTVPKKKAKAKTVKRRTTVTTRPRQPKRTLAFTGFGADVPVLATLLLAGSLVTLRRRRRRAG